MSAQQAVYAALAAAGSVTALVGARIYPDEAPEAADLPLVIHQITQVDPVRALDGGVAMTSSVASVTCWAATRAAANAVIDACAAALDAGGMYWTGRDDSVFDPQTGAYASVLSVEVPTF